MKSRLTFYIVCCCGLLLFGASAGTASADTIYQYAVFGNGNVTIAPKFTAEGLVGSNSDLTVYGNAHTQGLRAGGNLSVSVLANVDGDVLSNGNITFGNDGHISGNVSAAGTVALGTTTVGGTTSSGVVPDPFTPLSLPLLPVTPITGGGANVTKGNGQTTTLAPGVYGALSLGNLNTLNLSAGTYEFDSVSILGNLDLNLDITGGDIMLLVKGDMDVATLTDVFVNGTPLTTVRANNPEYALQMFTEVHGDVGIGNGGEWLGAVYTPYGNMDIGDNGLYLGGLYSDGTIDIDDTTTVVAVPEPATVALLVGGGLFVLLRRRKA